MTEHIVNVPTAKFNQVAPRPEVVKKFKYSEIFFSFQGEGKYCGTPTAWVRFWGCNLTCHGFGQKDIDKPETWDLVYQKLDLTPYKRMADLPVLDKCCDSGYSHEKQFAHLAYTGSAAEICDEIEKSMMSEFNPFGKFEHPISGQHAHMAFTGGEPMMSQNAMVDIMLEFAKRGNVPKYVTVETNGTQKARTKISEYLTGVFTDPKDFTAKQYAESFYMTDLANYAAESFSDLSPEYKALQGIEWFWSVSPKLYLSGETRADALHPEVVAEYKKLSNHGQLKFVVDGSARSWDAVVDFTKAFREAGITWDVHAMPLGATAEDQAAVQKDVALGAMARGYQVAIRAHCFVFGNQMST